VPSTNGNGTAVFATNLRVSPGEAETFYRRYSRRWQIENEYKIIKHDFLAKTSSKDYRVRLFYFVFAVLLYNIWRLTELEVRVHDSTFDAVVARLREGLEDSARHAVAELDEVTSFWRGAACYYGLGESMLRCLARGFPCRLCCRVCLLLPKSIADPNEFTVRLIYPPKL